jgi:hypothetical protein
MADDRRIKNYSLGLSGVILDPHHLLDGVSKEGLTNAQNAMHDPRMGFLGALRKRAGLARFNNAWAGGIILGGIPMAVADFGGAPVGGGAILGTGDSGEGGGIVGTSPGTGDMTGAPGGTFDGGAAVTSPAGVGAFTATSLFSGARLIAIGLDDNVGSNDGGRAWYLTSKNFADTAIKGTVSTGPCTVYSFPTYTTPFVNGCQGQPSCIGQDGRLYYAASHGNQATGGTVNGTLPIYVTDGGTATLLATIPASVHAEAIATGTTIRAGIMGMHAGYDGFIYITVKDKYTGQDTPGSCGRIFRLRPTTGELVEWSTGAATTPPPVFTTGVPYAINYFQGYAYFGVHSGLVDTTASVYASNGTEAVQDNSFNSDTLISTMVQFNGRLFLGTGVNKTVVTLASLFSRNPNVAPGSGTGWNGHVFDASRTGNGTNGNSYVSMVVYDATTMFVSWHAPSVKSIIYKVVADNPGDPTSTSFTITTAKSLTSSFGPLNLYLDQGVLYAISSGDTTQNVAWVSTDGGANWTDQSANFGALATNSFAIPVFFAMDQ